MSELTKAALIILTLNLFLFIAFPQAQLGHDVVQSLLSTSNGVIQPGSKLNSTLSNVTKGETGIIAGVMAFPDYVKKAMAIFVMIVEIFTSPFAVASYLIGLGVPTEVMIIYVGVVVGVYLLALMDWLRSGE